MNTDKIQPINTDGDTKKPLLHEDITYKIRVGVFNVSNKYGKGLKEQIYQNALAEEFTKLGIKFEQQKKNYCLNSSEK